MLNFGYALAVLALIALIPVFASCSYLFLLTIFSLIPRWKKLPETPTANFAILLPAHNDEKVIEKVVASLIADIEYPPELYDVIVIADNCRDSTSYLASFAGAQVLESTNDWKQGKGYALEWAFGQLKKKDYDAYLIIDVNSEVEKTALKYLDAAIAKGADAMQLSYSLRDADSSWKKRYEDVLLSGINYLRRQGRGRLGVSCGIAGNGLCLTKQILELVPFEAFTKVEGLEYHCQLVLAEEKVCFVSGAEVYGDPLAVDKKGTKALDGERFEIFSQYHSKLLKAVFKGNMSALDCLFDFYIPSLKMFFLGLIVIIFSGAMLFTAAIWRTDCEELLLVSMGIGGFALLSICMLISYIFAGMLKRKVSIVSWLAVLCFPFYIIGQFFIKFLVIFKAKGAHKTRGV